MATLQNENAEAHARREKINTLRTLGINPYPNKYDYTHNAKQIVDNFEKLEQEKINVSTCGRIMLYRVMGKSTFLTIKDVSGRVQVYIKSEQVGVDFYNNIFKKLIDIGDIIGVTGTLFKTQTGEISVYASKIELLTKTVNPLPDKFHGLTDTDLRYRQRYVDLIMNDDVRDRFVKRSQMISAVRDVMIHHNFLEVETPMMHPILGGAKARPFITHHNTLDMDLYLRIAPELYLKRLVVGGFERVFEINRNFRNEGVSTKHNPEFTMLEAYMAYADVNGVMELIEDIFSKVCFALNGEYTTIYKQITLNFAPPFKRISMHKLVLEHTGLDFEKIETDDEAIALVRGLEISVDTSKLKPSKWELMVLVFEERVEHKLIQPTFVIDYPTAVSPLSKAYPNNPDITERYELFICGMEMSNGFSELNDPVDQRARFEMQVSARESGDDEAMEMDNDFINALEYGMPPTGGLGIGIDRMAMLFLDVQSIRDTILFPHMRRLE